MTDKLMALKCTDVICTVTNCPYKNDNYTCKRDGVVLDGRCIGDPCIKRLKKRQ